MTELIETNALVEEHLHGGFGIDFAKCETDGFIEFAKRIKKHGVCAFFPTLATDSVENLKLQIKRIKEAQAKPPADAAKIAGVHLEACFLSPQKKGIHDESQLLAPTIENFKLLEDEVIKIVTLAPELDKNFALCDYLAQKGVKVSAGHCLGADLSHVSQVTHLYNAMGGFTHREPSTVVSALHDDRISVELIADMQHVQKDVVDLTLKIKPHSKIILISDALPIAHADFDSMEFCNKTIFLKDGKAVDKNGTIAGSVSFVADIIKNLVKTGVIDLKTAVQMASTNIMPVQHKILWDQELNIFI